jgi:hypothetical protein
MTPTFVFSLILLPSFSSTNDSVSMYCLTFLFAMYLQMVTFEELYFNSKIQLKVILNKTVKKYTMVSSRYLQPVF